MTHSPAATVAPEALVLDGDTRAALAIVRSLGSHGVRVTVGAPALESLAGASRHAGRRLRLPDAMGDPEGLGETLVALAAREPDRVWFPVTDASLAVVDRIRDQLTSVRLPIPNREALAWAWDKDRLPELARAAGLHTPRTWRPAGIEEVGALADELRYPLVLKPRRSRWRGADGFVAGQVGYVNTPATLLTTWEAMHARIPEPLIQEHVPGIGMGVFLLADRGRILARFAHRRLREKPPSGGVSVLSESIPVPSELIEPCDRLMAELRWHGVCMVEFKLDARDGRPWLIELNPRFWGSLALAIAAGVDFPWLLFQLALGEPPDEMPAYRAGVRNRWELGDLDHLLLRLRDPHGSVVDGAGRSRFQSLVAFLDPRAGRPEVFRWSDPGPGWHELRAYVKKLGRRRRGRAAGAGSRP